MQYFIFFFHWWMFSGVRGDGLIGQTGLHTHRQATHRIQTAQPSQKAQCISPEQPFLHKANNVFNSDSRALVCLYTHWWFL